MPCFTELDNRNQGDDVPKLQKGDKRNEKHALNSRIEYYETCSLDENWKPNDRPHLAEKEKKCSEA